MRNNFQSNVNGQMLGGGSIQHPLSIHSASIGTRWKPRGWKYIFTFLLVLAMSIGNVWGAYDVLFNGYSNTTKDNYYKSYTVGTKTVTVTASQSISSGSGDYYVQLGSAASDASTNYISVVANEYIDSVSFLMTGTGADKALIPALLCWNTAYDSSNKSYADSAIVHASQTVSAKGFSNAEWLDFDLSESSFKEVRVFKQAKNIVVKTAAKANFPASDAQTLQVYGVRIKLRSSAVSTYWMAFEANGHGTAPDTIKNLAKDSVIPSAPTAPTASGWNFVEWNTKADGSGTAWNWGTSKVTQDTTLYAKWTSSAATQSNITYTNTKGADNSNPAKYYEGTGVTSFAALADVDGFHFTGWNPPSIAADASGDKTIIATWVPTYNVSFDKGAGSGSVPEGFQKWEGAKFNLPGQGDITAPSGKAFDGWKANGTGDKLAANAEYTMTAADVNFVAQWKATPTTIFHWRSKSDSRTIDAANGTTTGGTTTLRTTDSGKSWSEEGATYASGVADDMKGTVSGKELKSGGNALYLELELTTGTFQEGDTVFVTGYLPWIVSTSTTFAPFDATDSIFTGSGKGSVNTGYSIIKEGVDASKLYVRRGRGAGSGIAAIKVIRPAQKDVKSTVYDLTAVKINGTAISAADLATLKTDEAYLLDLATEYPVGPTVKFARKTTITYEDDSQKVKNDTITVTASEVESKWQAQATIGTITYTVKMAKVSAAKVYYYDGATKLGEEIVAINGSPVNAGDYDDKTLASFVGWYNNADLAEEHKIANIAALVVTKDTTVYGKWNPVYAQSANLEQWVLDYGKTYDAWGQLGNLGYAGSFTNSLDSLDDNPTKDNRNYAYLGFKVKNESGKQIDFRLANGNTVKIKFGNVTTTPNIQYNKTGSYDEMPITEGVYSYTADGADAYISIKMADNKAVVFKQIMIGDAPEFETVTLPAIVTLDADGGTYADASLKYTGTPLVIGDATPADADHLFDGWYDGETKIDASAYVPTANVTLVAKYVVKPSPFSLTGLTYTVGAGEPQNVGYVEGTYTYTVELPYAGSYDAITVAATLKEAGSSIVDDATKVLTVTSLPGAATFTVSDGAEGTQLYTINFKKGAKDGVEIIGVVTTGGTNKTVSGLYKGDATVNLDSDKKIGNGKYIYVTLASGYTFEETDVLVVDVEKKSDLDGGTKALEITTGVGNIDGEVWKSIALEDYTTGENTIPLTGIAEEQTSIGLKRSTNQNAWINGLKVYRPMMPELTAISFNGVAATKGTGNAFSVTLPEAGTNLASLTIVPTIIRNAAHATTPQAVVSNEGAWKEGANTYRVMDKDGDYTDYTITITLQGEAPAPVIGTQPANVAYCAGNEPTLTVEATGNELHYAWFKESGETDEAVGTDAASYTVEAAGTYYVIVTNKKEGKLDKSVTSENAVVTLNAPASITTQPTDLKKQTEGANITLSVVAANATAYQWYSCDNKDKENATAITGADEAEYEFAAAAGFFYCEVTGLCGTIESNVAEVTVKRSAGCQYITATSGYETTEGGLYICGTSNSDGLKATSGTVFATASNNAKAIDAEAVGAFNKQYIIFKFPVDVEEFTLYGYSTSTRSINNVRVNDHIGTNSNTDKFTSAMEVEATKTATKVDNDISLTAVMAEPIDHSNYVNVKFNGAIEIYRICYTAALVEPKLPTLVNQELCASAPYETFDATITNAAACEGTVSYKWYSTNDTETPIATTAMFTPSAEGTYYVVVTHAAAGHVTRTVQSANLSVAHFDALAMVSHSDDVFQHKGTAATLSVVATGKNVAYVWYTCSNAAGDDAVAITPAQTEASLAIASVAEGVKYYKVVISHDCDATTLSHVFKVEGWDQLEQVDVTASTVWDMTNVSEDAINLKNLTPSKQNVRLLLANIEGVNNNASFNSQALMFEGQHIGRTSNNVKHLAGRYVQFNVTVPGMVSVTFASNDDNKERTIAVNGKKCTRDTTNATYLTYDVAVEPGSVEIIGYEGEDANQYVRISKIEFKATADYTRPVNPAYLGTLCWTNNAILGGATLYEFAGKNEYNYLVFDEVKENRLEAGKPYIFMPENGNTEIKVYNTDDAAALTQDQEPVNNMYGTITGKTLVPGQNDNMYYFSSNHIWAVKDFAVNISVPAYYCYVDYAAVLAAEPAPAPAPGRRRVTMGVNGKNTPTGIDAINASEQPMKLLINGQIFILRGEKMFDATGRLVK